MLSLKGVSNFPLYLTVVFLSFALDVLNVLLMNEVGSFGLLEGLVASFPDLSFKHVVDVLTLFSHG